MRRPPPAGSVRCRGGSTDRSSGDRPDPGHVSTRRLLTAAAALAAALALTACEAVVATDVTITSPGEVAVSVEVTFTEEAAAAISTGSDADVELRNLFEARGASDVSRDASSELVRYRASDLDPAAVAASAEVTGIASISASEQAEATVVSVEVTEPTALTDLLASYDPEAAGVLAAKTFVEVRVHAGGGIDTATYPASTEALVLDGDTATLRLALDHFEPGTLTVTGRPGGGFPWLAVPAVVVLAAAIALFVVRRRNQAAARG